MNGNKWYCMQQEMTSDRLVMIHMKKLANWPAICTHSSSMQPFTKMCNLLKSWKVWFLYKRRCLNGVVEVENDHLKSQYSLEREQEKPCVVSVKYQLL